jgi:SAM-dependent methyltransferase
MSADSGEPGLDPALPFTGERFVPGTPGEIWIEHWHRYHFATRWVRGKRVLDVACGEGYGSALLARHAAHVVGADLSDAAIAHAKRAYAGLANVEFACAPCTRLPIADASIEVAVSFETIEHILEQEAFLEELARVMKPDAILILSCPNKFAYSDKRGFVNEFHVKELYRDELSALLGKRFPHSFWYGQRPSFFSLIAPDSVSLGGAPVEGELVETEEARAMEAYSALTDPLYFVVVAGRERASIEATPPVLSVLADRDDWVHRDYQKVMRDVEDYFEARVLLEEQIRNREAAIVTLHGDARILQKAKEQLDAALAQREDTIDTLNAELTARNLAVTERDHEINRRRGWRWWLKLPLIRLGLLKE